MYIVDDQMCPHHPDEDYLKDKMSFTQGSVGIGPLPLFGVQSIAKSLSINTEISSKLSNMIAISSNSDQKSAGAKDATPFGHFNNNYIDRYKPQTLPIGSSTGSRDANSADISTAAMFNHFVKSVLSTDSPSVDNVDASTNYYIEVMNNRKGKNPGTRSSAMIPVSISFKTDGISGLAMGHAFTVPDQILPNTYSNSIARGPNKLEKDRLGFVIIGLSNSINGNIWETEVKANMIYLKNSLDFKPEGFNTGALSSGSFSSISGDNTSGTSNTNFTGTDADARKAIELYIGRSITDSEFSELISGTYAEASTNQQERAYVMAALLNRSRIKSKPIGSILREKNQFQSVTGTSSNGHQPSSNFINGPDSSNAKSIYGAATNILSQVPKNIINFTAANLAAYGAGTNPGYIQTLKNRGGIQIGQTIFSA